MTWQNVDNKHKKAFDKLFVSCEEAYEINYIVKIVKEEYPYLDLSTIRTAIAKCCIEIKSPRPRNKFMNCLRERLNVI